MDKRNKAILSCLAKTFDDSDDSQSVCSESSHYSKQSESLPKVTVQLEKLNALKESQVSNILQKSQQSERKNVQVHLSDVLSSEDEEFLSQPSTKKLKSSCQGTFSQEIQDPSSCRITDKQALTRKTINSDNIPLSTNVLNSKNGLQRNAEIATGDTDNFDNQEEHENHDRRRDDEVDEVVEDGNGRNDNDNVTAEHRGSADHNIAGGHDDIEDGYHNGINGEIIDQQNQEIGRDINLRNQAENNQNRGKRFSVLSIYIIIYHNVNI